MRILHIIDSLEMGGAENVLIGLAGGQRKEGHEVSVLQLVKAKNPTVTEKIVSSDVKVAWLQEDGSVYNPLLTLKLIKCLHSADIVHVHLFPALYWTALAKGLSMSKTPLVYTEHSTDNRRRNNMILHFLDKIIYKHGYKMIIACAERVMERFNQTFPDVRHVFYVNNGIDTQVFRDALSYSKQELLGIDESCFLVTMVARFMSMKRQDTVVEAIALLPEKIHAVFVGGTEDDEGLMRIKAFATDKGVITRVHFLYSRKDVPSILKSSDVVVMASDYEGLSLSSIEGMAAGKPMVATDVDGLREVVEGAGVLFENKNSKQLAGILSQLADNRDYCDKIALRCKKRAENFDVKEMVRKYLNIYDDVLSPN
jgi:glycosyltransferase involved in cell wall biosynthesis